MSELKPTCWLNHEWAGGGTLFAYPTIPARTASSGVQLHDRFWGMSGHTSARTCYCGVWRDCAKHTVEDRKLGWPSQILLACQFGTEPWEPPANLVEEATLRQRRMEGQLRLKWDWQDQGYRLVEFGLEVRQSIEERGFRSASKGAEIDQLDLAIDPIPIPDETASLSFRASGQIRARRNFGEALTGEALRFTVMGSVPPIPNWMIY